MLVEAVAGSLAGILAVQKVSRRSGLVKAGLFVGGANVCIAQALGLIANAKPLEIVVDNAAGLLDGLLAAILAIRLLRFGQKRPLVLLRRYGYWSWPIPTILC